MALGKVGGLGGCRRAKLPIPSMSLSFPRSPAEPVSAGTGPVAAEPGRGRAAAAGSQRAALGSPQRQHRARRAPLSCSRHHHGQRDTMGRGTEGQEGGVGSPTTPTSHSDVAASPHGAQGAVGEMLAPTPGCKRKGQGWKDQHPLQ